MASRAAQNPIPIRLACLIALSLLALTGCASTPRTPSKLTSILATTPRTAQELLVTTSFSKTDIQDLYQATDLSVSQTLEQAKQAFESGALTKAMVLTQIAVDKRPDYPDSYYQLAQASIAAGDRERAEQAIAGLIRIKPELSEAPPVAELKTALKAIKPFDSQMLMSVEIARQALSRYNSARGDLQRAQLVRLAIDALRPYKIESDLLYPDLWRYGFGLAIIEEDASLGQMCLVMFDRLEAAGFEAGWLDTSRKLAKSKGWDQAMIEFSLDHQQARKHLAKVQAGDSAAQAALGLAIAEGKGLPADEYLAAYWCRAALENGSTDPAVKLALSRALRKRASNEKDREFHDEADFWLIQAADKGYATAQYEAGKRLFFWDGPLSVEYFAQAAEQGHPSSQFQMGLHFLKDESEIRLNSGNVRKYGVRGYDYDAEGYYAASRNAKGEKIWVNEVVYFIQYPIHDYWVGDHPDADIITAEKWFRLASEQGHAASYYYLAQIMRHKHQFHAALEFIDKFIESYNFSDELEFIIWHPIDKGRAGSRLEPLDLHSTKERAEIIRRQIIHRIALQQ